LTFNLDHGNIHVDFPEAIPGFPVEDINIKVPTAIMGLWFVKSKPVPYLIREPTPKAHARQALNQNGSGPAGYILDHFSPLPMNDNHLYPAKRGTTPGTLTFSRKDQQYGAEGTDLPR
jgi:hypothetical protein